MSGGRGQSTAGRRDEGGVILLMGAITMTVVIMAASLAIDIGFQAQQKRHDHLLADMIALDAVRSLVSDPTGASTTAAAEASATRNSFDYAASGNGLTAVAGNFTGGVFTPGDCPCSAVQARPSSTAHDFLVPRSHPEWATAVATLEDEAQFQVGSTLATAAADPDCPPLTPGPPPAGVPGPCSLLNAVLGALGATTGVSAVGYQGLLNGNFTLGAIATQLGVGALSPTQILATQFTAGQVAAAASALMGPGSAATQVSTVAGELKADTSYNNTAVALGSALGITGSDTGMATNVNLLDLVTGTGELADGRAALDIPLATVNLPSFGTVAVSGSAIVPARKSRFGPPGVSATDTQITLNLTVPVNITVGLNLYNLSLPLQITVGGATGTLQANAAAPYTPAISCTGTTPTGINIHTVFNNLVTTVGNGTVSVAGLAAGTVTGSVTEPSNATESPLAYPLNFIPDPPDGGVAYNTASNPGTPVDNLTVNVSVAGLTAADVLNQLTGTLGGPPSPTSVLGELTTALDPVLSESMGTHIGSADLLGGDQAPLCGVPALAQ